MTDAPQKIQADLASLYYQLAALEVVVSHTLGSLTNVDAKVAAAAAFRKRSVIPEVQAHLDRYAESLLNAAQYKPTGPAFEVIDGGKAESGPAVYLD